MSDPYRSNIVSSKFHKSVAIIPEGWVDMKGKCIHCYEYFYCTLWFGFTDRHCAQIYPLGDCNDTVMDSNLEAPNHHSKAPFPSINLTTTSSLFPSRLVHSSDYPTTTTRPETCWGRPDVQLWSSDTHYRGSSRHTETRCWHATPPWRTTCICVTSLYTGVFY